ncbi:hypothetical protein IX84_30430 [Phaeodactylibacter xiamenensis]|uniref:Uncharacterized protein n=1 Tax=Phaeodactylibacter xiamenensis TaxID=1524460 RepID=A0A098S1D3_9BACT|nr:hypothetical protein IX84_30430 [Phaeodactylibacter xiamenensis]
MQNGILKGFSAKIFKISENPYFFCLSFQTFNELFAELKVYGNENSDCKPKKVTTKTKNIL